jgi:hypothetical protein
MDDLDDDMFVIEDEHQGGLVEVGRSAADPASLTMSFDGTRLNRLRRVATGAPARAHVAYELVFDNEDHDALSGELYAVYRLNNPVLKARGEILFAGRVALIDDSGPFVVRSVGDPDFPAA